MSFRVEPSPAGGYVVRLAGHDRPVSRHDTEEEADEWVARHSAPGAPSRPPSRARFVGLTDGTQILLRAPRPGDGAAASGARLVATHPATGEVVGAVAPDGGAWVAPAWSGRGLDRHLRFESDPFSEG